MSQNSCFSFSLKVPEDSHVKAGPPRHKQYSTSTRPTIPRTPKHRLSVDANMQIPEVLNTASKKDLLRRVSHKHAHSGSRARAAIISTHIIIKLILYVNSPSNH